MRTAAGLALRVLGCALFLPVAVVGIIVITVPFMLAASGAYLLWGGNEGRTDYLLTRGAVGVDAAVWLFRIADQVQQKG